MGFLDILRGKRELKQPAPDRLFAMATAYVKMEMELALKTSGKALGNLFATHPPMEKRIAALSRLEMQLQGTAA